MEKVKKNAKLAVKESTELAGNVENGTVNILSFKNFKAKINKKETKKVKNDVKSAKKAVKSLQSEKKSIETSANEEEKDAQESRKSSKSLQSEKKSIESSANEEDPKLVESLSETSVMEGTLESPQPTTVQPTVASADPKANALLQVFWDLASLDAEERQSATLRLIQMLTERQTDHSTDGTEQLLKDQEQLSRAFHADVLYSFNRLLRGLSSSRDGARQGFSLALTELLASFFVPCVSTSLLVECLKKHTEIASGMKGIEERDMIYGRVFGYLAILESGALLSAQCSSEDAIRSTLQDILHFAKKKPFLREWALNVVVKIFSSETSSSSSSDELVQFAEQWLLGEKSPLLKMDVGPELFMAFLVLFSRNSTACSHLANYLDVDTSFGLLTGANLSKVASILRESTSSHPRVHSVWQYVLQHLFASPDEQVLQQFWQVVVNDGLLCSSSIEKMFLGLSLFELMLSELIQRNIPSSCLFSSGFVSCLLKNIADTSSKLHKTAHHVIASMLKIAETNRKVALQFVAALGGPSGDRSLQRMRNLPSNKKILDELLSVGLSSSDGNDEAVLEHVEWLIQSSCQQLSDSTANSSNDQNEEETKLSPTESYRQWCLDQFLVLIKSDKVAKTSTWIAKVFRFLIVHAFYSTGSPIQDSQFPELGVECRPAFTSPTVDAFRRCFWAFLTEVSLRTTDGKDQKWLVQAAMMIKDLDSKTKAGVPLKKKKNKVTPSSSLKSIRVEWDSEIMESVDNVFALLADLEKQDTGDVLIYRFQALLALVCLQIGTSLDEEEVGELAGSIDELIQCYSHMRQASNEKLSPYSVLVDLMVSMLSKESNATKNEPLSINGFTLRVCNSTALSMRLTRHILPLLFREFCTSLDDEGVAILCRVIDPFMAARTGEDVMLEDVVEDHHHHDVDSDAEMSDIEPVDPELSSKIREALQVHEEVDEDDNLNDEQMLAMGFDAKIAEIFRNREIEKKQQTYGALLVVNFKFRVLELIDTYAKQLQQANGQEDASQRAFDLAVILLRSALVYSDPSKLIDSLRKLKSRTEEQNNLLQHVNTGVMDLSTEHRQSLLNKILAVIRNHLVKVPYKDKSIDDLDCKFKRLLVLAENTTELEGVTLPWIRKECWPAFSEMLYSLVRNNIQHFSDADIVPVLSNVWSGTLLPLLLTRSSHVPYSVLTAYIQKRIMSTQMYWKTFGADLVDCLVKKQKGETVLTGFHQHELWQLLGLLLKQNRSVDDWFVEQVLPRFMKLIQSTLADACREDLEPRKPARMKVILCVIGELLRKTKKMKEETNVIVSKHYGQTMALWSLCQQMLILCGVPKESIAKPVRSDAVKPKKRESDDAAQPTPKKKQKKQK